MVHANRRTPLTGLWIDRIRAEGPARFDDYMESCLYHPQHGYYTSRVPKTGRRDFFTSPEVGPLFGRLLGWQFREMWEQMGRPGSFSLVEQGAGDGRLARDVLAWVEEQGGEFARAFHYHLVEVSEPFREYAAERLARFGDRVKISPELPERTIEGCLFSNELVDALPVRRFVQRGNALREIRIGVREGKKGLELAEVEQDAGDSLPAEYLAAYGAPLEEGQVVEMNLRALDWLAQAASRLERGFLLTVDYGYRARELYGPGRLRGTLLAYRDHRSNEDWLGWPGLQDLTAHVNFTALEGKGAALGLESLGLVTQTHFLLTLARVSGWMERLESLPPGRERLEQTQQFRQLIEPEGMGETFKVLVQGRKVPGARLSGLGPL